MTAQNKLEIPAEKLVSLLRGKLKCIDPDGIGSRLPEYLYNELRNDDHIDFIGHLADCVACLIASTVYDLTLDHLKSFPDDPVVEFIQETRSGIECDDEDE